MEKKKAIPKLVIKTEPDRINLEKLRDAIQTDMPIETTKDSTNIPCFIEDADYFQDYQPKLDQSNRIYTTKYTDEEYLYLDPTEINIQPIYIEHLSFYTQNIWFEKFNIDERFENLVQMIDESNADFVCLQEVTYDFHKAIVGSKAIRDRYYFSGNQIHSYGVLILSKWPVYFYEFKFEGSRMGRSLLVAETIFNGNSFFIATSHLESLDNVDKRKDQMKFINQLLDGHDHIVMGDFNFDYKWETEFTHIDWDKYIDVWCQLKDSKEKSWTMAKTSYWNAVTFDHIILSSNSFLPKYISKVGNYCCRNFPEDSQNETANDSIIRTPSDHLGLYAVLSSH